MLKKKSEELTEDELIEQEIDKEIPDISPLNFNDYISMLKNKTDEELEYESLLSEEDREEELTSKQEIKKLLIRGCFTAVGVIILMIGGMALFLKINETEINAVTKPLLKEYYKNNYNKNVSFTSVEEICYKDENNEQKCEGLVLATTKDNKHLMTLNNDLIGDDINNQIVSNLNDYITNTLNIKMLMEEIKYSYQDYYYDYNLKLPYINVLPNKSIDELINSKKVTINYRGIYEGDINIGTFTNLLTNFSNDSKIYLIKQRNGMPTKLIIISKNKVNEIDITGNREIEEKIYSFEYNRNQNSISSSKITRYVDSEIIDYEDYHLSNIMEISFDKNSYYNETDLPSYYIFRFDNAMIDANNLLQISSYNNAYKEKDINDYTNLVIIEFGGNTYIIGDEEITIGSLTKNKSFLCNLGLC